MNNYFTCIPILLFVCCGGCNLLNSEGRLSIHIQTDKKDYNLTTDDSIEVTITNKSYQTIHYSTCLSKTLELVENNKTARTSGFPVCECLCPAELKPGESIPVHISSISAEAFQFQTDNQVLKESATYRIKYSLYFDEAFGDDPIPPEYSRSNRFTITGVEQ